MNIFDKSWVDPTTGELISIEELEDWLLDCIAVDREFNLAPWLPEAGAMNASDGLGSR